MTVQLELQQVLQPWRLLRIPRRSENEETFIPPDVLKARSFLLSSGMEGTPLSKQIAEAAQRRAGNATFRGSPTNSSANSPAVSPETSRESVSQSSMRTPTPRVLHTTKAENADKYSANRDASRIPVPSPAKLSQPFPEIAQKAQLWQVPSPAQPVDSPQNEISSFALSGEDSLTQSVMEDHGETHRQPSSASASSADLDSASGREGLLFNGSMQSPAAERGIGDMNAVPQSPLVSASAGGSASPDSMPDSAYTGSDNHGAHSTLKKEVDADADSIASLGSYLELDDGSGQPTPGSTIPAISMVTEAERSPVSGDAAGFTFSALSVTPTHGSPQNHFFQHRTAHSAPAKRKLVFNTPPPKLCNRKPVKAPKAPVRSLWRFLAVLGAIFGLLAMCLLAIFITQPTLWEASVKALGGPSGMSSLWQDAAVHAESTSGLCQAVAHMGRRYWVIARYHIGSLWPAAAPASSLVDVADEVVPESNTVEVWESDTRESSVALLSSVGNILHHAKDEASSLLSSATALWEGEDSGCSSAGRLFGTCTVTETPRIDFWSVCSTEDMCMEYSLDGESDARCRLFHATPELTWLQSSGMHHLFQVPSEARKMLAAGLSMAYTQLAATWASAKDVAHAGFQFQLPLDSFKELVGRSQQHLRFADKMKSLSLDRYGTLAISSGLLALTCCVGPALLALMTRNHSKASSSKQKQSDGVPPMETGPSVQPDQAIRSEAAATRRRRSTRIKQIAHVPASTPRPAMSVDETFCTAASHGYSLRSRPSPYQAQQDLADTAATPSRCRR